MPSYPGQEQTDWFIRALINQYQRGYCKMRSDPGKPSLFWWLAVMAIWRYDVEVHWVHLHKTPASALLPMQETETGRRRLMIVEGVAKLWDGAVASRFGTLVSWCDLAGVPMWLDVPWVATQSGRSTTSAATAPRASSVQHRIAALKNAQPLSWLGSDSQSRLAGVCYLPNEVFQRSIPSSS